MSFDGINMTIPVSGLAESQPLTVTCSLEQVEGR